MSQSPAESTEDSDDYLDAFRQLAVKIRNGDSFSGRERNCAFLNTGSGPFADVSGVTGFGQPSDSRAMALADWDRDGDLDILLTNRTAPRFQILRNDLPKDARWIALKLEGDPSKNCPRDAMGARVEIIGETGAVGRITRTLHAGDAFLSQSTSWLVIGLGKLESIDRVDVRWPGGSTESFTNLAVNQRYHLKQGSASATAVTLPPIALAEGAMELSPASGTRRIRLSQPLQITGWKYKSADGQEHTVGAKATLINLWASWCEPCVDELKEWGAAGEKFADANLDVLALNMESLDAAEAEAFLKKTGFGMPWGYPGEGLIDSINQLIRQAIYSHDDLPAPTSLLIDKGGWLCAIYKGPVPVEQILKDRATLGISPETAAREALEYPGRWATNGFQKHPVAIARSLMGGGYLDDAEAHLTEYLDDNLVPPGTDKAKNGRIADILFHLGEIAIQRGKTETAVSFYRESLQHNPYNIPALNNLAWHLATTADTNLRNGEEAVKHAEFMLQAPGLSTNPESLATLAAAYAGAGRFDDAIITTKQILHLLEPNSDLTNTHRERLKRFESRQSLTF